MNLANGCFLIAHFSHLNGEIGSRKDTSGGWSTVIGLSRLTFAICRIRAADGTRIGGLDSGLLVVLVVFVLEESSLK